MPLKIKKLLGLLVSPKLYNTACKGSLAHWTHLGSSIHHLESGCTRYIQQVWWYCLSLINVWLKIGGVILGFVDYVLACGTC